MISLKIAQVSTGGPATVDAQRLAGDVRALWGSEKKHGMSDFLHAAWPTERYVAKHSTGTLLLCRVFAIEKLLCAFRQC